MKKLIYLIVLLLITMTSFSVDALTNSGKLYEMYYEESKVNVFASDESYHSLDYNAIMIKSTADNEIYYCIEPEVPFLLLNEAVTGSHTIYEGMTTIINNSRLTDATFKRVMLLAYYGYGYKSSGVDHSSLKWYGITQVLIWNTVRPDVDYVFKSSRYGDIDPSLYKKEVKELNDLVANHETLPSFSGDTVKLSKGEIVTLTDKNNVIKNFIVSDNDNVSFSVKDNTLTIKGLKDGEIRTSFTKPILNSFRLYVSDTWQNLVSRGNPGLKYGNLNLKVETGKVSIKKLNEKGLFSDDLKGTKFNLYDKEDNLIKEITINGEEESLELPFGSYYLKEISSTPRYNLNEEVFPFDLDEDNKEVVIEVSNTVVIGELIIEKKYGGADEEYLPEKDAIFAILDEDNHLIETIKTNKEGIAKTKLEYGTYIVRQISDKEGYKNVDDFIVDITKSTTYKYELKNVKKSVLQILKEDYSSNKPLKDTKLGIYNSNDILIYEGMTNEDGILKVSNLDVGKYYVKELEAPKYYKLSLEKFEFEVKDDGEFIKIVIDNERNKGNFKLIKVDKKTNEVLKDAKIRITYLDTNEVLYEGLTNELGEIYLENIEAGNYEVSEITSPKGYMLNKEKIYFEIVNDNDEITITLPNEKIEMPNTNASIDITIVMVIICSFMILSFLKRKHYE